MSEIEIAKKIAPLFEALCSKLLAAGIDRDAIVSVMINGGISLALQGDKSAAVSGYLRAHADEIDRAAENAGSVH